MKWPFLLCLLICGVALSQRTTQNTDMEKQPRLIVVRATRFQFQPSDVTIEKGQPVTLQLVSEDVLHSLVVSDLGINLKDTQVGHPDSITFTPEQDGTFKGACGIFCGIGHGRMALTIHVIDAH